MSGKIPSAPRKVLAQLSYNSSVKSSVPSPSPAEQKNLLNIIKNEMFALDDLTTTFPLYREGAFKANPLNDPQFSDNGMVKGVGISLGFKPYKGITFKFTRPDVAQVFETNDYGKIRGVFTISLEDQANMQKMVGEIESTLDTGSWDLTVKPLTQDIEMTYPVDYKSAEPADLPVTFGKENGLEATTMSLIELNDHLRTGTVGSVTGIMNLWVQSDTKGKPKDLKGGYYFAVKSIELE